jgi:hypothetical protein
MALLAGCNSLNVIDGFALKTTAKGSDLLVVGSPSTVSLQAQSTLNQMGLSGVVSKDGEAIRVTTKTKTGQEVTLKFSSEKTASGEQTRVHVEGHNGPDDPVYIQLSAQLQALNRR